MIIVSACLLGARCKYNGGHNESPQVKEFLQGKSYVPICPERLGELSTPRPPSEMRDGRVFSETGEEVTKEFEEGAKKAFALALEKAKAKGEEIELAVLKARSPSCGSGTIYDGTFSRTVIEGDGKMAALLKEHGIKVVSEEDIADVKL